MMNVPARRSQDSRNHWAGALAFFLSLTGLMSVRVVRLLLPRQREKSSDQHRRPEDVYVSHAVNDGAFQACWGGHWRPALPQKSRKTKNPLKNREKKENICFRPIRNLKAEKMNFHPGHFEFSYWLKFLFIPSDFVENTDQVVNLTNDFR